MSAPLPIPQFLETDPGVVLQAMVADFEASTGRTLYPAQVEQLQINGFAYRESLVRLDVQHAAEQNLVAFAVGVNLDNLALDRGVTRLSAVPAKTTERFTLASVQVTDTPIPAGTRIQSRDGRVIFATNVAGLVLAGTLYNDLPVTCTTPGPGGNGYLAGTVDNLLDAIALVASVGNQTTSDGGLDTESDDALRRRVQLAPYAYGSAGSEEAYTFWALSFGLEILDAVVTSPSGGHIQVAILTVSGVPTSGQMTDMQAYLTGERIRPLTDTVAVVGANRLTYAITAVLTIYDTFDGPTVQAQAIAAAQALAADRRRSLGKDVTPTQVINALSVPGVYDVALTLPAAVLTATPGDFCDCTAITVTIGGTTVG